MVVESQLGLISTPWVGAILVAGALGLTVLSGVLDRRTETRVATA
jgi:predicted MFS family arabinose efflux permease